MDLPITIIIKDKGSEILDKNSYIAAGGEGTVCKKGSVAFKIYHDPKRMIPISKIQELQAIAHLNNVLGPRDILLNSKNNKPIGFTMPYKSKTEFLTRLFNKNFKLDNNITPEIIADLIKQMQITVSEIHKQKILIVDLNEMNFLTDSKYKTIYFIDVDSYQTPSFKATALMESVRDRISPKGQFSEGTDWFSFAVVSFQMYMTYHPYMKGRHPNYQPRDWSSRMDKNVSIFHPDVVLADIWKDFNVIPKPHLEWYKAVFHKGDRCAPPLPDGVILVSSAQPTHITGNEKFVVTEILGYPENIKSYYFINGVPHIITKKGIYVGSRKLRDFPLGADSVSLAAVSGMDAVIVIKNDDRVLFEDVNGAPIGQIAATQAMHYKGHIYTVYNGAMTENSFKYLGKKVLHLTKNVSNIFEPATKLYSGVAIQDILGKCWVAIPYEQGRCFSGPIVELNGQRIIDAKFENGVLIAVSEKKGQYTRHILCFNENITSYTCRKDEKINYVPVNFTVLGNGVCIHIPDDDKVEIFRDNQKIKTVNDPPITTDMQLVNDAVNVLFVNKNKLYSMRLK